MGSLDGAWTGTSPVGLRHAVTLFIQEGQILLSSPLWDRPLLGKGTFEGDLLDVSFAHTLTLPALNQEVTYQAAIKVSREGSEWVGTLEESVSGWVKGLSREGPIRLVGSAPPQSPLDPYPFEMLPESGPKGLPSFWGEKENPQCSGLGWKYGKDASCANCVYSKYECDADSASTCAENILSTVHLMDKVVRGESGDLGWEDCREGKCSDLDALQCAERLLVRAAGFQVDAATIAPALDREVEAQVWLGMDAQNQSAFAFEFFPVAAPARERTLLEDLIHTNQKILQRSIYLPVAMTPTMERMALADLSARVDYAHLEPSTWGEVWQWAHMASFVWPSITVGVPLSPSDPSALRAGPVPLFRGPEDIESGDSNFEVALGYALSKAEVLARLQDEAWGAFLEAETAQFNIDATRYQIESSYDAKLRDLCGISADGHTPDYEHCGDSLGTVASLSLGVQAARHRIQKAEAAAAANLLSIQIEEDRIASLGDLEDSISNQIDALNRQAIRAVDTFGKKRAAATLAAAERECLRAHQLGSLQREATDGQCKVQLQTELMQGYSVFGWGVPDPAAALLIHKNCDTQLKSISAEVDIKCDSMRDQADLSSTLEELDRLEKSEFMVVSQAIDSILRKSKHAEDVINSTATVRNMTNQIVWHAADVEDAKVEEKVASAAWLASYMEALHLMVERETTLQALVSNNPSDPHSQARFLWDQWVLGRNAREQFELARKAAAQVLRTLEYEIGWELPSLWGKLEEIRRASDLETFLSCLDTVHTDYLLTHGQDQSYSTIISLRRDVWGIANPIDGPSGTISEVQQFRNRLASPLYWKDGILEVPMVLSGGDLEIFSPYLCDDRLESISVQFVGDHLGDLEAEVLVTRSGPGVLIRCNDQEPTPVLFPEWKILVQAGVNAPGTENSGFADWPTQGTQWTFMWDPSSPPNSDMDWQGLVDVEITLHRHAKTINQIGSYTPDCG